MRRFSQTAARHLCFVRRITVAGRGRKKPLLTHLITFQKKASTVILLMVLIEASSHPSHSS